MPDPSHEAACTAAVDLPDVRCASTDHPHRGSHHATRTLEDGTRVTVFWWTPRDPDADAQMDAELHTSTPLPDGSQPPPALPRSLRTRSDYARALVQQ